MWSAIGHLIVGFAIGYTLVSLFILMMNASKRRGPF